MPSPLGLWAHLHGLGAELAMHEVGQAGDLRLAEVSASESSKKLTLRHLQQNVGDGRLGQAVVLEKTLEVDTSLSPDVPLTMPSGSSGDR